MKKEQFLDELRNKLKGLPKEDLDDRILFYEEAIDDRMADGKSEEEAVADLGSIDWIVNEIAKDVPLTKLVRERVKPKRSLRGWEIILLILGFPLWFPLVVVGFVLCLVFYLLVWVFVLVAYVVETALVIGSIGSLIAFFLYLPTGSPNLIALGSFLIGLGGALLFLFACIGITKATIALSKSIMTSTKARFIRKGSN